MMYEEIEYFGRRERQERRAAKNARTVEARRLHQQLAERYAALVRRPAAADPLSSLRTCGAL